MHTMVLNPVADDIEYNNEWSVEDQVAFHHNGDYSGNVIIAWFELGITKKFEVTIPFWMLAEFVGRAKQSEATEKIESMSGRDFLNFNVLETL